MKEQLKVFITALIEDGRSADEIEDILGRYFDLLKKNGLRDGLEYYLMKTGPHDKR